MDKKRTRRKYTVEFKAEAIEMAQKLGIIKAADGLGVHETSIRSWIKKSKGLNGQQLHPKDKKSYGELEKENRRLQKENGYLKEINKVLKKSTAIFSIDHMGNLK